MKYKQDEILQMVPIRKPMLCIDQICEIEYGNFVRGYRDICSNEYWADCHFVDRPVFPGTLIIETMAQISAFMFYKKNCTRTLESYLGKVDNVKFIENVIPNCRMYIKAWLIIKMDKIAKMRCYAYVNDRIVAKGEITLYFLNSLE